MPSLLRPPSHRGPLIAAGATVLTVGVALQQIRLDDLAAGWQALICGGLAALLLWLAVGAPLEGGRPPAYQSVLTVCGLLLLVPGLLHLAELLGADYGAGVPPGTGVWVSATLALIAGALAVRRNSGIAALIAAAGGAGVLLFGLEWVAEPGPRAYRWLLLLLALTFVVLSLLVRGSRPRQSEQLVSAAGLAILAIPGMVLFGALFGIFSGFASADLLPGLWEGVVAAAGFSLVAYAAADRAPGPAYLGFANLLAFAIVTSATAQDTLEWWPLVLLAAGGLMLAAGLRPARPLPPEPEGYRREDLPPSARVEDGEQVFTVRD
jgi:hypothetical protein